MEKSKRMVTLATNIEVQTWNAEAPVKANTARAEGQVQVARGVFVVIGARDANIVVVAAKEALANEEAPAKNEASDEQCDIKFVTYDDYVKSLYARQKH